jgi:hypothetical protein
VFLVVCVHENVVFWAGYPRSHSGCVVGVALSGFRILNSCFLRLSFFDVLRRGSRFFSLSGSLSPNESSKVGVAGLAFGDVGVFKVAADGVLV